jgi:type I restriction-modification system DNA methylase subunit
MDQQAAKRLIENTFSQPFDEGRFRHFAINLLNNVDEGKAFNWTAGAYIKDSFKDHIKKYRRLGTYTDPNGQKIDVLVSHLRNQWALDRSRATQRNFVATYLKKRGEKEAALIAYYTDDPEDWRFSFVRMEYQEEVTPAGKVRVKEEFTPARRYSFLVGKNEPSHTAQEQLLPLLEDDNPPTIDTIEQAFSVEAVTKRFYTDYRGLFEKLTAEIDRLVEQDERVREEFERKTIEVANFAKKLLGQIVFLYFLQKKGWLGVGKDEQGNLKPWGTGPKNFLRRLFEKEFIDYGNFFDDVLEPLFYEALATERPDDYYSRFNCKIPFLNGGLFEAIHDYNWREIDVLLPNDLFQQVFDTFDLYNFTVREDEPLEKEVAVDPEMLGKVFENLLPENLRKGKGTYYTPRPIVHYMCQESLINYLDSAINTGGVPLVSPAQERLFKGSEPEQMPLEKMGHKTVVLLKDIEEFIRKSEFAVEHDVAKEAGTKTYKYQVPESIRAHAKLLDEKLAEIKVCDPAIGSGAFPVGMMHEIVNARNVLTTYLSDKSGRDTYTLKRHCIQESLYGVDIDPGAIDIAKLRLWLSLIVDEEDYQTINPLPNLDYKIMQGNSLIEDFHGISLDVGKSDNCDLLGKDLELERLIKDLYEKQNAFFNATHPGEKRRLKDAVEEAVLAVFRYRLQQEKKPYYDSLKGIERTASALSGTLRDQFLREEKAKLNKRFDFDPVAVECELREMTHGNKLRSFFPWRLYFADVFQRQGGFDVVIANPPYVRQELISEQKPLLKTAFPDVYHGVADLYVYFYRRALDIARSSGCVTFISSNKFFRAGYGEKLRTYLQENTKLKTVIDFGDLPIFEATTYPCVLVISNHRPDGDQSTTQALNVRDIEIIKHLPDAVAREGWLQPQHSLRREGWSLEQPEVLTLLEKLRHSGTPLGEHVGGRLYYGIKTGLNEAFVIDQATRDRFIAEDPRSVEIIKPWLRGQDVKRWRTDWANKYLIFLQNSGDRDAHNPWGTAKTESAARITFREAYPAIHEHMSKYETPLRERSDQGRFWWELRPCDYYAKFEKPKIVYPDIAKKPEFAYNSTGAYGGNTMYILPTDELCLLGVLNSSIVEFFYCRISSSIQNDYLRFIAMYMEQVPIPLSSQAHRAAIEALVCKLLDAEGQGPQVSEWEQELNALIYELYGLTKDEITIIERREISG